MEEQAAELDPLDPSPSGDAVGVGEALPVEVVSVDGGAAGFSRRAQTPESLGHFSAPNTPLPQKANMQPAKGTR